MMAIKELYEKEITRRINPAVVVSEMEEYFINQEIEEYVFTQGITKNVYKFLDAIANKKEGKTGVWISGYYGSGKSHFIKYLFYCLNKKYREKAFVNFKEAVKNVGALEEPNPNLLALLQKKLDALEMDEIMFNIDAVSDNEDEKDRITRVLLNQLNQFRGFNNTNIALALYLEKPLHEIGKLEDFKSQIKKEFNEDWSGNQLRFTRMSLSKVLDIAKGCNSELDIDSLKKVILDKNQDYNIDFLINEFQDFLKNKPENYRLIFLLDEVSQYIGSNTALLLNLQTIVEEIGTKIGTKIWMVCTAQQDLSNLIDTTDTKTGDFGKILGRFETIISLESQDATYITKKRVLEKKADGIGTLSEYYKNNKGAIENQFVFNHDLYENFKGKEDFTLTYPFVPYQFRLISDVFESFSNVGYVGQGVKNTERSILGITHYTAEKCKDEKVGYFVPFDLFFNDQFDKNLTFIARSILDRAYNINEVKDDLFSKRVVNTLFMISNLGESHRVNFPATVDNLALLLMDAVDTPKLEVQKQVTAILELLVDKNIVQVSEGKYRFLKDDEIDVAQLIKTTAVNSEDRLDYFYKDIIDKVLKPKPDISFFGNKNFKAAISIDDKEIIRNGDFKIKFSVFDITDIQQLAYSSPAQDLVIAIGEWFNTDKDLKAKVQDYVRTQKFIANNFANATGTRVETLNNFRSNNVILLNEIKLRFEQRFLNTSMVSSQQVISAEQLNGANVTSRLEDMINKHLQETYKKHALSNAYATSNADLINNAKSKQVKANTGLDPAEEELVNKMSLMGENPNVGDVVKVFEKAPYGWKDVATLDILLKIAQKGVKRFEWKNDSIDFVQFTDKALNSRERDSILILNQKAHSQEEINEFIQTVNHEIFVENIIANSSDLKEAVDQLKLKVGAKLVEVNKLKDEYDVYPFGIHLKKFHKELTELFTARDQEQVLELVKQNKSTLKADRDQYMFVVEFVQHNFTTYQQIKDFISNNKSNFDALDEAEQVTTQKLLEYIQSDNEPWDTLPQMKKAYKEIHDALDKKIKHLRMEAVKMYEVVFSEINNRRHDLGITEENLTTDDSYINRISKEKSLSQLEIYILKINEFRADNFKILEDFKAKAEAKKSGKEYQHSVTINVANEMPPTTIENAEQLEDYLKKLREKLMVKLAKNQKIFLN
ncbi:MULTISPECIES: BREX system P-loop protein BrxC [Flavobacterium]|uniref:BREX system P-loop protein BrxC n=1 Tax=Flavobacterium TaxID=237 RepID=UPI001FCAF2EB|nr:MULTISPECIES: BREX system P-loop protein BrxC [Flavobacterium]UOK42521.1 BREX system P-loop protein BrxC [Flavobacterium enshiense]